MRVKRDAEKRVTYIHYFHFIDIFHDDYYMLLKCLYCSSFIYIMLIFYKNYATHITRQHTTNATTLRRKASISRLLKARCLLNYYGIIY